MPTGFKISFVLFLHLKITVFRLQNYLGRVAIDCRSVAYYVKKKLDFLQQLCDIGHSVTFLLVSYSTAFCKEKNQTYKRFQHTAKLQSKN